MSRRGRLQMLAVSMSYEEMEAEYDREQDELLMFESCLDDDDDHPWTDADEAGLEEYEEQRRIRIAEANEY